MKHKLIFILFACLFRFNQSAQHINFPIQNFSPKEYGKNYNSQNLCVLQDRSGLVYFGNGNGILQYDGKSWIFIPVKKGAYVSSLAMDSTGTVFVGSQNEFGYLKANAFGKLIYHSLSSSLKGIDKEFGSIIKTYAINNEIIFQCQEKLFIYDKDSTLKIILPSTTFHTSYIVNNEFYVRERKKGLLKLSNHTLKGIKGGDLFADMGIFSMLPYKDKGDVLVATMEMGLWRYSPSATNDLEVFTPIKTSNDEFILNSGLYGGIKLSDGNYAFNTLKAGVIMMDENGQILSVINKEMGLRDNDIKQMFEDTQHNIWMALNNGVSMVSYRSNLTYYSDESGLVGSVHAINREGGGFFVATSNGLFYRNNRSSLTDKYSRFPGVNSQIWSLFKTNKTLVAGGDDGIYLLSTSSPVKVSDVKCRAINYDSTHHVWLIGNETGIVILNANWQFIKTIPEVNTEIISIELSRNNLNNTVDAWAGTSFQGVFHVSIDDRLGTQVNWIGLPDSLSNECIYPFKLDDQIAFGSSTGVYSYSEKNGYELVPLIDGLVFDQKVTELYQYKKNIWLSINNHLVLFDREAGNVVETPFFPIDMGQLLCFYQDSSVCWIGADDGLIRYDLTNKRDYLKSFPIQIRKVNCGKDSLIFFGNEDLKQKNRSIIHLPYNLNSMYFEYAGLFFEDRNKNLYSYKLEGQDTSWSKWSNETKAVFTNLHEGNYTFRVKSKNIYGALSNEATFLFTISSPWYRTIWAYSAYTLSFILLVYGFNKIRTKKLRKEKEQLEKIVLERTAEISRQKDEIEHKKHIVDEQHKEITDSINYAQRIQRALLASDKMLAKHFHDYFIFFQPKDIVSGDFYWAAELSNNNFALVTADSTGHGVPGAIMSMLNISCLNDAIEANKLTEPSEILNHTRKKIISYLSNDGSAEGGKDGMDCSLMSFNFKKKQLTFSAANNPVWIVRNMELLEFDPDKMPIGKHDKDQIPFVQQTIDLQTGDMVYALTDGLPDQFGGDKGKKFMYKRLKEMLIALSEKPTEEQRESLAKAFTEWKGRLEQVDDVTLIGIKV